MALRVLVVEDDPHNRRIATTILRASGMEIEEASDGEAALAAIEARRPDVVLLDLSLPRLDGYGVARRLKADPRWRDLPLIAFTAHALTIDEARAREAGCDHFLAKPIDPDEIVRNVQRAAGGARK